MRRCNRLPWLIVACTVWPAHAENAFFVIPFGGEPGAPLAHSYDYGKAPAAEGTYTMRIPSVDPEIAAVLPDIELTIEAANKVVQRVYAARAYRALTECSMAQEVIQQKLVKALPASYTGTGEAWQYQSADGKVVGGVYCMTARHLPFPTLTVELVLAPGAR
jgi:hypothetical protein